MKISTKLAIVMLTFSVSAATIGTVYSSSAIKKALKGNISTSQLHETNQVMDKIDRFLYERTIDMQLITGRSQIINYIQSPTLHSSEESSLMIMQLNNIRIAAGVWGDFTLLDTSGKLKLTTVHEEKINKLITQNQFQETFKAALNGQVAASDVYLEDASNIPIMLFMAPIQAQTAGKPVIGVMAGELAWATVLQIITEPGDNVVAHLINSDGYLLGSSHPDFDIKEILTKKITDSSVFKESTKDEAVKYQSQVLPSIDNAKIKVLTTFVREQGYSSYNGNNWLMVFETPTASAFAPATKLAHDMIVSSIAITTITLLGLLWYGYRTVIRPVRSLRNAMFKIIGGDHDSRVKITSKDEIGELGLAFNQMSEGLANSEKNLRQEQARLTASINSLEVGYFMTDLDNNILTINSSARELLKLASEEPVEEWDYKTVTELLRSSVDLPAVLKGCKDSGHVLKIKEVNFKNRVLSLFAGPIFNKTEKDETNVIGTVILLEDITEAIVQARSKDEFFSIASHELRTPLTTIRGNSSMILQLYADILKDPSFKEMIEDINGSSVRLIEIVNDFLDVSRIEQGKMQYTFAEIKLDKIIESIVYEMKPVLKEKKLSLDIEHKTLDTIPTIIADSNRVKQIIYNLIGNALKFTEKGGIKVSAKEEGKMVKVIISDTGSGIALEGQKMLFRKFQQTGSSLLTRDATKGTGLGLYISKLLVEGMGGKIALESSTEGKGTSFSFTLPIASKIAIADILTETSQQTGKIDINTGLTIKK